VDPSPPLPVALQKAALRKKYSRLRSEYLASLPEGLRALVLNRPPAPIAEMTAPGTTVGLYYQIGAEAPATGWARWFAEHGCRTALPWFSSRDAAMAFRLWDNPHDEELLAPGPWRAPQPEKDAEEVIPDLVVVPLLAFTAQGHRLGQGGGHYDRWLEQHADVPAIGLSWDCQFAEDLPVERHDRTLDAVVTPTRIYQGRT
jgi:5,10-methenyltetrahydrofolate synthetase